MAFQGEDISGAKVVYGEDSALVARVKDGTIVFDAFFAGTREMENVELYICRTERVLDRLSKHRRLYDFF